ncbi:GspE/PulE family protein [Aquifex aeolicus]|uniref:Type IV pilus assembly protein TapB n=1 Tax=Aquifex aeolicus (strain VF5) TaxID=224324 RepID=O67782_AQUAE|nr:GspE/PulE family protein [Aquifex aeolicus]AAC07748.1 type IV pilus assembly protein TapB [Aquifex aeolicus VF5]
MDKERIEKLLTLFAKAGYIKDGDIKKVLSEIQKDEDPIEALIRLGLITEDQLTEFFKQHIPSRVVEEINTSEIPAEVLNIVPRNLIEKYKVIPFKVENNKLFIYTFDPYNQDMLNELRFITKMHVIPFYAPPSVINKALDELFPKVTEILEEIPAEEIVIEKVDEEVSLDEALKSADAAPVVKLANLIIYEAVRRDASDIHIEPQEKVLRVRFRIDGVLRIFKEFPPVIKDGLITRIKIMANMDISERRKPQDGRIRVNVSGKKIDLRVNTVPTVYGEKVVMRIQEAEKYLKVKLEDLGFEPDDLEKYRRAIWKPWGMILVSGPTGSGKTTTLYASLMERNTPDVNIMTVEDPVEVSIPGINQVQVNEKIGLTFANVLRAFLRQDPDIILVGEIRDSETAEIAIRASLTGHLVFSTVHANDAPTTVTRLVDMGIESFLVGSSLILVVAQRLIRKLCPKCKEKADIPKDVLLRIGVIEDPSEEVVIYKAHEGGCEYCNYTGYKGRTAVHEILEVDDDIKELIIRGATHDVIRKKAIEKGMRTLYKNGLLKVKRGITSIEEVNRVLAV